MDFTVAFTDSRSPRFKVMDTDEAIGAGILTGKHQLYDADHDTFKRGKGYLVQGDAVVIFKRDKGYSYIEYTNPDTAKTIKAWIESSDIANPLPDPNAMK